MTKSNRLIKEKSPYLLQHAHNPVDWYPWGPEVFAKAKKENKPIFLSIGYATCHWCHVMEEESFKDKDVAALMNDTFVCIKVDREERPDIDAVYMKACQLLTGSGGWPLTIIMTPDKEPFFAGTYFPKQARLGQIGMIELTRHIKETWANRHDDVLQSARMLTESLQTVERGQSDVNEATLHNCYEQLHQRFDPINGGFGSAPKFPTPHTILFLLRYAKRTGKGLDMAEKTLQALRTGGIYDHLGFGFHRYATDDAWHIPHFEKMLYDQALLVMAYAEAYQATRKQEYRQTMHDAATYVLRDMTSPDGAFYSAEDADSEGEEGKFYTWTKDEIIRILGTADAFFSVYALDQGVIYQHAPSTPDADKARDTLFRHRGQRVRPLKDDKILTDWNGLMIAALAKATQVTGDQQYAHAAERAADFILKTMMHQGRLFHRYRDNAAITGMLDDYAFLILGLMELYEATWTIDYLQKACDIQRILKKFFWDHSGGFFSTAHDAEQLITRQKEMYEGAVPAGNSVALFNMVRLAAITGDVTLEQDASLLCKAWSGELNMAPSEHTQLLCALDFIIGPSTVIVLAGKADTLLTAIRNHYYPNTFLLHQHEKLRDLAPFSRHIPLDKTAAYVCQHGSCSLPTTNVSVIIRQLG
ncbi:thioredoxin domain-containing protein [Candidatus Woesearchaeota archaeon]|nr:thioredoxin domain-containing protein [Candidatus Woesearchaeota archaeon]